MMLTVLFGDLDMWLDPAYIMPHDITTWGFKGDSQRLFLRGQWTLVRLTGTQTVPLALRFLRCSHIGLGVVTNLLRWAAHDGSLGTGSSREEEFVTSSASRRPVFRDPATPATSTDNPRDITPFDRRSSGSRSPRSQRRPLGASARSQRRSSPSTRRLEGAPAGRGQEKLTPRDNVGSRQMQTSSNAPLFSDLSPLMSGCVVQKTRGRYISAEGCYSCAATLGYSRLEHQSFDDMKSE